MSALKKAIRELRLLVSELLVSCAVDMAPRDTHLRCELSVWLNEYIIRDRTDRAMEDFRKQIHENHPS